MTEGSELERGTDYALGETEIDQNKLNEKTRQLKDKPNHINKTKSVRQNRQSKGEKKEKETK